jgi:hypothetical protein
VDNAETMERFWYEATYLLETLVMKAAGQDQNGMDLTFTAGPIEVRNKTRASKFVDTMKDSNARPSPGMHTDIRKPLGNIFKNYLEKLEDKRKYPYKEGPKDLTLIVLTDGLWAGVRDKDEVRQKIVKFVKNLEEVIGDRVKDRPISLEFIQFGDDEDATYRLRQLDNDLRWEDIP